MPKSTPPDMSQSEAAYEQLYSAIQSGIFRPGDRVRETDIAERFTLSRTPVREAIRRLEADGIVEHKARSGAVIRSLTHAEVVELYEMRLILERSAAEMAAKHAVSAEIDELTDLNAAIAKTSDPTQAARINQHFHRCIYQAARNRFLLDMGRTLNNALMLLGPTTLEGKARLETVCEQHQNIIDAIEARDEAGAGAAAQAHFETSLRYRLRTMRE